MTVSSRLFVALLGSTALFAQTALATPLPDGAAFTAEMTAALDTVLFEDSMGWEHDTYDSGSFKTRVTSTPDNDTLVIVGGYTYNGGQIGRIRMEIVEGPQGAAVRCLQYVDLEDECHAVYGHEDGSFAPLVAQTAGDAAYLDPDADAMDADAMDAETPAAEDDAMASVGLWSMDAATADRIEAQRYADNNLSDVVYAPFKPQRNPANQDAVTYSFTHPDGQSDHCVRVEGINSERYALSLRAGDYVCSIDGTHFASAEDIMRYISSRTVGTTITVTSFTPGTSLVSSRIRLSGVG